MHLISRAEGPCVYVTPATSPLPALQKQRLPPPLFRSKPGRPTTFPNAEKPIIQANFHFPLVGYTCFEDGFFLLTSALLCKSHSPARERGVSSLLVTEEHGR